MYTEDDKYSKHKHNKKNTSNRGSINKINNNYRDVSYEEDYYKDYYDDYNINNSYVDASFNDMKNKNKKTSVNQLDTSYTDDYSDQVSFNYTKDTINKKKYVVIILILAIILFVLIVILMRSINVKPPIGDTTTYIRLNETELSLKMGDTRKLDALLSGNSSDYKIEWFSNDDNVITVDNSGNIRAINEGEAIVLVAYYLNNNVYDAQCHIYVSK